MNGTLRFYKLDLWGIELYLIDKGESVISSPEVISHFTNNPLLFEWV